MMLSSAPPAGSVGASGSAAAAAARASASGAAQGPSAAASAATSAPADALARAVLLAAGSSAAAAGKRPREVSPSAHASAAALGGGGGPADVSPDAELEAPACEEGEDKIEQRVAIWNRVTRRKTSGKAAPMRKNLGAYLSEHADCEVYAGQDREGSCRRGGAEGGLGLHAPAGFFRADASARASGGGPGGCHLRPPTHPQLHHPQHLLGGAHGGRPMPRRDMDSPETGYARTTGWRLSTAPLARPPAAHAPSLHLLSPVPPALRPPARCAQPVWDPLLLAGDQAVARDDLGDGAGLARAERDAAAARHAPPHLRGAGARAAAPACVPRACAQPPSPPPPRAAPPRRCR